MTDRTKTICPTIFDLRGIKINKFGKQREVVAKVYKLISVVWIDP